MTLTKSELEIMGVIWAAGRPLSRSEIIALSVNPSWKQSSIHILLNGLLKKGAIVESGYVKRGKSLSRLFAAKISGEDYYASTVFATGNQNELPMLFSALIRSEELTPELIAELEAMLAQRKKELQEQHV